MSSTSLAPVLARPHVHADVEARRGEVARVEYDGAAPRADPARDELAELSTLKAMRLLAGSIVQGSAGRPALNAAARRTRSDRRRAVMPSSSNGHMRRKMPSRRSDIVAQRPPADEASAAPSGSRRASGAGCAGARTAQDHAPPGRAAPGSRTRSAFTPPAELISQPLIGRATSSTSSRPWLHGASRALPRRHGRGQRRRRAVGAPRQASTVSTSTVRPIHLCQAKA